MYIWLILAQLLNSRQQRILTDPTPFFTISGNFHVNLNFFWLSGSLEKDFYNIFPILAQVKTDSPTVASVDPKWPCFLQTCEFVQMSEIKFSFYDPVALEKKIQNIFPI
jgi:hypothetical protein